MRSMHGCMSAFHLKWAKTYNPKYYSLLSSLPLRTIPFDLLRLYFA